MTVASVYIYDVKPGRMEGFHTDLRRAKGIIDRLGTGIQSIRAFQAMVSGAATGHVTFRVTYDNLSSYAAIIETEAEDEEFNRMIAEASGPDASATMATHAIGTDLLDPAGDGTASIILTATGHVKPGRMDDLLDVLRTTKEHALGHGAKQVTHRQVSVARPATGLIASTYEYDSLSDWAASREALTTSEAGQKVGAMLASEDSPLVSGSLALGLVREISL